MTTTTAKPQTPTYSFGDFSINNTTAPANEHTRDAVVALANAAAENARAIAAIAAALKGGNATMDNGIRIGGGE